VHTLPNNQGRSAARNAGVAAAFGSLVVFMDCDCVPADGYLTAHIDAMSGGAIASTGHVTGSGHGFWNRYQQEASLRRRNQHETGMMYAGSSQNLAVRRSAFDTVGGFDTGYRRYGFEDRDLLIRLAELGQVAWALGAVVSHQDALNLSLVVTKMAEAAEHSSQRFLERHPVPYRLLGYAGIDCRVRPWLAVMGKFLAPLASTVAVGFDAMRSDQWLPYPIAKWVVKSTGAAAYLAGTARAR
jgi:GT2 family glycosyltransferase